MPSRYEPGSVVVVPFPYSDRHAEKRRPALVVSGNELAERGLVWVLMITSARTGPAPGDIPIEDLGMAGLPRPCVVRPTKIACIEPSRILKRSGQLDSAAAGRALAAVHSFIADPDDPQRQDRDRAHE